MQLDVQFHTSIATAAGTLNCLLFHELENVTPSGGSEAPGLSEEA